LLFTPSGQEMHLAYVSSSPGPTRVCWTRNKVQQQRCCS